MNIIFSGDFYQYGPIREAPLYTPIGSSTKKLKDIVKFCLGHLAWKTVDMVIVLTQQMRMSTDPEYGAAVGRLRVRKCTYEDADLFNSRVIRSPEHPSGIDMGSLDNIDATTIVHRNSIWHALNAQKA